MELLKKEKQEIYNKINNMPNETSEDIKKLENLGSFYISIFQEKDIKTFSYRYVEAIEYIKAIYNRLGKNIPDAMWDIHRERLKIEEEQGITFANYSSFKNKVKRKANPKSGMRNHSPLPGLSKSKSTIQVKSFKNK